MAARGKLVLILEDDASMAATLALILIDGGYKVLGPAANVSEAMDILDKASPDVALVDYQLGDSTSEVLLPVLEGQRVSICVVSGSLREELPSQFARHAALHKPFGPHELIAQIDRLCSA